MKDIIQKLKDIEVIKKSGEDKKILCPTEKERLILRFKKISNPN